MERLNLFAPHVRANPYPHYAELRRSAPVTQIDPGGFWAVSRHDDILAVLRSPALFSSSGARAMTMQPWIPRNPAADSLILMDPPQHTQVRNLITHAFGSRVIPRVEPLARKVCSDFAARVREGGEIDVCETISLALPAQVIANLLGFDPSLTSHFKIWAEDLTGIHPGTPPEAQARILQSISDLERYILEVLADRRRARRDDLVSDLLDAEIDGRRLGEDELVSFLFLLLSAGFDTTMHQITNALRVLADHPEVVARLRAEPASIPAFVEEVLRFDSSLHGTLRVTLGEAELSGVRLPPGSVVLALLASANRDEKHIQDPDRFDMSRKQRPNVAFGHGPHSCLGAALARAEVRIVIEELVPHIQAARVKREPEWNVSMILRGARSCPMEFDLAPAPSR